ncbi:hypothetical protein KA005_85900 [bacterium]|nr:hypothetical protein [bacterium]
MGILDKAKDVAKKGVDLGKKGVEFGIDTGKKGVDATKEAVRKKTCVECKHYNPIDEEKGDCPIAGERLASADIATCPQRAFEPK